MNTAPWRGVPPTLGRLLRERDDIMAISGAYLWFLKYDGTLLDSESQIDVSKQRKPPEIAFPPNDNVFEIESYSFDIAQSLNIGSQSTGAGAGKVTFNPFSITRKTDRASPVLFQMACSGTAFESVVLVPSEVSRSERGVAGVREIHVQAGRRQVDRLGLRRRDSRDRHVPIRWPGRRVLDAEPPMVPWARGFSRME